MKRLSELEYGDKAIVREIRASEHELNCLGVRLNKRLKMVTKQPIKGPVVVIIDDMEIAMGLDTANQVMVDNE